MLATILLPKNITIYKIILNQHVTNKKCLKSQLDPTKYIQEILSRYSFLLRDLSSERLKFIIRKKGHFFPEKGMKQLQILFPTD